MNIKIIKRIENLEAQIGQPGAAPSLIMICWESNKNVWAFTKIYDTAGNKTRQRTGTADSLREIGFQADFHGRIILNTLGNPDPDIYETALWFDADELRTGLDPNAPHTVYIEKITPDAEETTVEITISEAPGEGSKNG